MSIGNALSRGIFVVAAKRTPFGAFGGCLKDFTPVDLQVFASEAALHDIPKKDVGSVVIGNVLSASSADSPYLARHVSLRCGLPVEIPAYVVNRLCGSGFQSIVNGIHEILIGDVSIALTGGVDNMSAAPFALRNVRFGTKLGTDPPLEDMMWAALTDRYTNTPMGVAAENLAEKFSITRDEVDAFAIESQRRWAAADKSGMFKDEIVPITIKGKKGTTIEVIQDEHPKPNSTLEAISKLQPVFKKGGVVTAASSSGICDGAGAVVLASEEAVQRLGLKPLARIVGYGVAGCDPSIMGIGPVPAIEAMLKKTGLSLGQMDEIEINEAFGAQTLACQKSLNIPLEKLNTCGGAIAMGHPLAASGSRISAHLVYKLRRKNLKYGIGSACIGGGQGIAIMFEKM